VLTTTTCHTADLPDLAAVRALLDAAFEGDFADDDLDHALGGMHVLVHDDGVLVAHGSVVRRQFLIGGVPRAVGYVESVAVARKRQGLGSLVMTELERIVVAGHGVGFLSASDEGALLYESRGWPVWRGELFVLAPEGLRRTPEDDSGVRVFDPSGALDLDADLACDWRAGDVW